jgi:transposase-like protein
MRYPASEKLEIIRLVEQSHLAVRPTLAKLGIPRATFYRWYDRYLSDGPEALDDRSPRPDRVWNRIPDDIRERIKNLALDEPALSPRELAVRFTDSESYFVSEASVYRLLKALDLIPVPPSSSSRRRRSSRTRPRRPTSYGRPTSPTSRSSAGDGSTCRPCSTTSRATSSPGSCARR